MSSEFRRQLVEGIPEQLPQPAAIDRSVPRAPKRKAELSASERRLALHNALRYFPEALHAQLVGEFAEELETTGRIYMHRYRPGYAMHARPLSEYPAKSSQAAAIMLMIQNNLDPRVAQYPYELITYGGNGAVFQNWAQYRLTMRYLAELTDQQTLVLYSGHPLGVFPSASELPRVVITNGMVIPSQASPADYERLSALGVTSYGQMTAGSFMYIGPQGIVHGTTITLMNAGRQYLGLQADETLAGRLFVSSGLGGMSGAQGKAASIAGACSIIAEVDPAAAEKRLAQGWVADVERDLDRLLRRIDRARRAKQPLSLAYLGNVVDLWEKLIASDVSVDLGSDQTSLHNPYGGGYYPASLGFEQGRALLGSDPQAFAEHVDRSLRRHVDAVNRLAERGMRFWDYGNAFLLHASRIGADVCLGDGFRYPSYVEDIMGPLCFDYGFGPFRWVCTSGSQADLRATDRIAAAVLRDYAAGVDGSIRQQVEDNLRWIEAAEEAQLVVGSAARILYADAEGRIAIAEAFNRAVAGGEISAAVVLGRDHHDVSGTDSPYRETANIRDGSNVCADMAVHNVIGDAMRGATWVSLHNGGGVGWGQAINGGFGLVLDGSARASAALRSMLHWDVNNGVARRAWAGNPGAKQAIADAQRREPRLRVTTSHRVDAALLDSVFDEV
ncbi:MAG: urocanate hydratase [Deltaproteobacteria bacterium]|nr:urocanate hydratase [Deltaproteobacteria bacterium]